MEDGNFIYRKRGCNSLPLSTSLWVLSQVRTCTDIHTYVTSSVQTDCQGGLGKC